MSKTRAKPRQIDVMPDITGILPLLHDFSHARKETSSALHINFSNVRKIDSIGLAVLLGLFFLGKERLDKYEVNFTWSNSHKINNFFNNLNLLGILNSLGFENKNRSTIDLFDGVKNLLDTPENSINSFVNDPGSLQKIILFRPKLYKTRQEALDSFSRALKSFMRMNTPRTFNHEQIIKVFIELAKNTYDHSEGIGIAGLYLKTDKNIQNVQFVYCDTGDGICKNVRNYLAASERLEEKGTFLKHLIDKGSASDFLHKAFQAGFSTKQGNGVNHGMGLTLIAQGAAGCGFTVCLRDADSIIDLTGIEEPYTHTKLRAKSSRTTAPKLLMFHIEREVQSDTTKST